MRTYLDLYYSGIEDAARALDVYLPDEKPEAIFLYIHGGGLDHGSRKRNSDDIARYLTERGIAYATMDYRMYPNAAYPDYIVDAAEAVAFVKREADNLFDGCDRLYVGGSSAGGYISMMLCFDRKYLAAVGLSNSDIAGYFHDAGQPTAHFRVLTERGIDPRRIIVDDSCPLYHIGTEEKYPPMRFIVSDNDMQNRYEQTMLTLSTLRHFGYTDFDHVVMKGSHCAYCGEVDEAGDVILAKMIFEFIEKVGK